MITVDYFKPNGPCWCCMGGLSDTAILEQIHPRNILTLPDLSVVPSMSVLILCVIHSCRESSSVAYVCVCVCVCVPSLTHRVLCVE
jgi:hypothetical protein